MRVLGKACVGREGIEAFHLGEFEGRECVDGANADEGGLSRLAPRDPGSTAEPAGSGRHAPEGSAGLCAGEFGSCARLRLAMKAALELTPGPRCATPGAVQLQAPGCCRSSAARAKPLIWSVCLPPFPLWSRIPVRPPSAVLGFTPHASLMHFRPVPATA